MNIFKKILGLFKKEKPEEVEEQVPSAECLEEIAFHMMEKKKVNAIRALRQHTGWGLKESKVYIDEMYPPKTLGDLIQEQMEADSLNDPFDNA